MADSPSGVASLPPEVFYGWYRLGLPADHTLWSHSTRELTAGAKKAIEANLVPAGLSNQIETIEESINQIRAASSLEPAPEGKPSTLGDLLRSLPAEQRLTGDQQVTVARLVHEHGNTDEVWKQMKTAGLSKVISAVKRTLELGEVSLGHAPLVRALQSKSNPERADSIEFLTTLEPADWIELVYEHGVPPGAELDSDAYIEKLQANVETRFRTQVLSRQLDKASGNT
jgi:hypothetical protein